MRVIRVAVADDDAAFRTALVDVLDADPRFHVVGASADGVDLVQLVTQSRPDLVVLDVRMPGGGPQAAREVRVAGLQWETAGPVVAALTAQTAVVTVVAMLREGVAAYLVKGRVGSDLHDLLVRAMDGEVVLAAPTGAQALRVVLADPA